MPSYPAGRQGGLFGGAASGGVTQPPSAGRTVSRPEHTGNMAAEQHDTGGTELGRFLRARRSQVTPADVGFTPGAGVRRTPGLRREEVAALAGVSIDYYTRLERGKETRPSPAVTDALTRALKLDADEHEDLRALAARAARYAPEPPHAPSRTVRPQLRLLGTILHSVRRGSGLSQAVVFDGALRDSIRTPCACTASPACSKS